MSEYKGRYCEAGVDESTAALPGLMFYELSSLMSGSPWKRSEGEAYVDTFQGEINMMAQLTLLLVPETRLAVPEARQWLGQHKPNCRQRVATAPARQGRHHERLA